MGAVLAACIGYWLIKNAVESPDRFLEVTLIGITNGSIYALVALGYTLVYGIIELINFAHGDNFMLGRFQTNGIVNAGSFQIPLLPHVVRPRDPTRGSGDGQLVVGTEDLHDPRVSLLLDALLHGHQRFDRAHRLQAAP